MCGIAGFCNLHRHNFSIDPSLLNKMQKTIEHRGPDGFRTWFCKKNEIALVHRRLSIIDLSQAAFQPMFDDLIQFTIPRQPLPYLAGGNK